MHQLLKSFIYLLILKGQLFYKCLEKVIPYWDIIYILF